MWKDEVDDGRLQQLLLLMRCETARYNLFLFLFIYFIPL